MAEWSRGKEPREAMIKLMETKGYRTYTGNGTGGWRIDNNIFIKNDIGL